MRTFNFEIVAKDSEIRLNFPGGQTVAISPTTDGLVYTSDWNDRHFTYCFDGETGAPFAHVKDETKEEIVAREEYSSEEQHTSEMYVAMSSLGKVKPINWVNADVLWDIDVDEYGDILEEAGVLERTENRLRFNISQFEAYLEYLCDEEDRMVEFLDRICEVVELEEAYEHESRRFYTPGFESTVLQRPDGYVIEMDLQNPFDALMPIRGSRFFDVMYQMFEH